jgi:folate-binding protein YgfZ
MPIAILPDRAVLEVAGADRVGFLQGLVSNDVALAAPAGEAPGRAVWAALLTPQGKWLADFFIFAEPERLLLDVEAAQRPMLLQKLSRFRLRSQVVLAAIDHMVAVGWGGAALPPGTVAPDPRLAAAGWRALLTPPGAGQPPVPDPTLPTTPLQASPSTPFPAMDATPADWDRHRLALGLPDGTRDQESEQTVLLEAGYDELQGVSWTKGCYLGQELTARTKYRGLLKRRLVPVRVAGPLPPRGTPILRDGQAVGEMRSGHDDLGMALLRLAAIGAGPLRCGEAVLHPAPPPWLRLPETAGAS